MPFVDDIFLMDETILKGNFKLELCHDTLESKGFRLSGTKTKQMECKFSKSRNKNEGAVRLDGQQITKSESF